MSQSHSRSQNEIPPRPKSVGGELDLERVGLAVRGIMFGEVRVIIQDGVIVQIERIEKQRLR